VIDTPLAESGIVGTAIGMALNGLLPVAEIQFADFIHPAMNQIMNEAAKIRYRSNGDFGCPLVVRAPFGGGIRGALYHSQSVESLFAHVPGLKIVIPATPYDAKGLLIQAIRDDDPVIFLEHKALYTVEGDVPEEAYAIPFAEANIVREGGDVTVVALGRMVHLVEQAAGELAGEGIECEIIDPRTTSPLDEDTILESVESTGRLVVVDEANPRCGMGADIIALAAREAFSDLKAAPRMVTPPHTPVPFSPVLEDAYVPTPATIADAVRATAGAAAGSAA
jgi:pyruvate dehydrogenase E1 component beta subunit